MSRRFSELALAVALVACGGHGTVPASALADLDASAFELAARREASWRACPKIVHPLLWRIEKAGKASFVFGTRHVGVGMARLPAVVTDAFAHAKQVVFESLSDAGMRDVDGDASPMNLPSLRTALGPDASARMVALLGDDMAASVDAATPAEMIAFLATLYLDYEARLDDELEAVALENGKHVGALETPAELAVLTTRWLGIDELRRELLETRGRRALRDKAMKNLAAYCAGRDPEDDPEDLRIRDALVVDRNHAWLPELERVLGEGDAFVAVGAGHLRGQGSLVELLRARGYAVTRVE